MANYDQSLQPHPNPDAASGLFRVCCKQEVPPKDESSNVLFGPRPFVKSRCALVSQTIGILMLPSATSLPSDADSDRVVLAVVDLSTNSASRN